MEGLFDSSNCKGFLDSWDSLMDDKVSITDEAPLTLIQKINVGLRLRAVPCLSGRVEANSFQLFFDELQVGAETISTKFESNLVIG